MNLNHTEQSDQLSPLAEKAESPLKRITLSTLNNHGSWFIQYESYWTKFSISIGPRIKHWVLVLFWSSLVVTVINMVMPHHCWGYWSKFWLFTFGRRHFLNSLTVSCHHLYATFGNFRQFWQPLTTFGNSQHLLVTLGNHWQLMATGGLLVQILIVNIRSLTFSKLSHPSPYRLRLVSRV